MIATAAPISNSGRGGYSLLEVMVAMLILMVGLLGLLQSVNIALEQNLRNTLREQAVALGEQQMNLLRTAPAFSNLTLARVPVRGVERAFFVNRTGAVASPLTRELGVTVTWTYKNVPYRHQVKSLAAR